jgi:hypothetical protein
MLLWMTVKPAKALVEWVRCSALLSPPALQAPVNLQVTRALQSSLRLAAQSRLEQISNATRLATERERSRGEVGG